MSRAAASQRKVTHVAVGVLVRSDGSVLLADRPTGKPYAGFWEFPGGKIEPGEDVATALERELREELGVDIGQSVPWVTFEFDYPHAYVELQFRVVRQWRGDPHSREGQRLGFFDPAGALPQPLLPAAVPTLRWLRLPRTVLVADLQNASALAAGAGDRRWTGRDEALPVVVVDTDWRDAGAGRAFALVRTDSAARRPLLLASGPGAQWLAGADGAVLDAGETAHCQRDDLGLLGAWVDSAEDLQAAAKARCDFVLVRTSVLAKELCKRPAPLPAYFHSDRASIAARESGELPGQGRWIDLRSPVARAGC